MLECDWRRKLFPRADAKLAVGMAQVHLYGPQGYEELLAYLAVTESIGGHPRDAELTWS
jgi:hypothetical protein